MVLKRLGRWLGFGQEAASTPAELQWHDPGPSNPFGVRVLDCRPFTSSLVSASSDEGIAARFVAQRSSDGSELLRADIVDPVSVETSLVFPHNGEALEGIVAKADTMETKWDIYVYDSVFLFARSWTGNLTYRAFASIGDTEIQVTRIECPEDEVDLAASAVYFLLSSHAMGRVLPHQIPAGMSDQPLQTIGMWSFARYGKMAWYATEADVTRIPWDSPQT